MAGPSGFDAAPPNEADFDVRLRARLARLEAAIPSPRPPVVTAVTDRSGGRRRIGRRTAALLVAAAILVGATAVGAQRILWPDQPEAALEVEIAAALAAGDGCLTAHDAEAVIRPRMDAAGYGDWVIEVRPGATESLCATIGYVAPHHAVVVMPAAGEEVAGAISLMSEELVSNCYSREEAIGLVRSTLTSLGVTNFEVRADPWGPGPQMPIDQIDRYQAKAAEGCTLWAGLGWDANGRALYHLSGDWP